MSAPQRELADPPSDAVSSTKFSPHSIDRLLVSSWDKHVYLYDTSGDGNGNRIHTFEHRAPVLDACFGKDDHEIFSGSLDCDVRKIDVSTSEQTVLSTHNKAVKAVVYSKEHSMVISGSWDSTVHIHHPDQKPDSPATINLPSKIFCLAVTATKLVVAMASRALWIYDLSSLHLLSTDAVSPPPNIINAKPLQCRESSLKFMFRAIACIPSDEGYATSSIEGRIAVEWFDSSEESQKRKYAFKCHRLNVKDPDTDEDVDVVYPVHALAFHPTMGTMVSGGGDGCVFLWDPVARRRLKAYSQLDAGVAALDFNMNGSVLAIAVSPGFEDGNEYEAKGKVKLYLRELSENEAKPKKK